MRSLAVMGLARSMMGLSWLVERARKCPSTCGGEDGGEVIAMPVGGGDSRMVRLVVARLEIASLEEPPPPLSGSFASRLPFLARLGLPSDL